MSTADDMQGLAGMMAMFPKMMGTVGRRDRLAFLAVAERMIEGEAPKVDAPPASHVAICNCGQPATIDNLCATCLT